MSARHCDVVIAGGGLAGLTLAMQLRASKPGLDIVVLERAKTEPPLASHKVGESTVEIGAHYLAQTLGLQSLLESSQLRKFGLRFFFGAPRADLAVADELGASDFFPNVTYQLDRGRLERDLFGLLERDGVDVRRGCMVRGTSSLENASGHRIRFIDGEGEQDIACRWFVDASGRAAFLKRRKSLERQPRHATCAAWFRLDEVVDVEDWSSDEDWKARCNGTGRWYSTNHLMGPGYWVWVIPLVNERTSIGLVSDPAILPLERFNTFERFLGWAGQEQPMLAAALEGREASLMDFRYFASLASDSKQVWSAEGWAMSGESGVFADPFYSPGTDYIAMANTYITDFVTSELGPAELGQRTRFFHALYRSFFASTMSLYRGQYAGLGDTRLMAVKSTWDYAYYWSILAWIWFRGVLVDSKFLMSAEAEFQKALALNSHMQSAFRKRAKDRRVIEPGGRFIDQQAIPILRQLNQALARPSDQIGKELMFNCAQLAEVAVELEGLLDAEGVPGRRLRSGLLGDLAGRLD